MSLKDRLKKIGYLLVDLLIVLALAVLITLVLIGLSSLVLSQDPPRRVLEPNPPVFLGPNPPRLTPRERVAPHPSDAVGVVLDMLRDNPRAPVLRALWYPFDRDPDIAKGQIQALVFAVNQALNHSDQEQPLQVLANGVLFIDLGKMGGEDPDTVASLVETWDRFGGTEVGRDDHDPFFLTNQEQIVGVNKLISVQVKGPIKVTAFPLGTDISNPGDLAGTQLRLQALRKVQLAKPWNTFDDECLITFVDFIALVPKTALIQLPVEVVTRVPAPYLDQEMMEEIGEWSECSAPIVHGGEFIRRALTQVDGIGLWYSFRQISKSPTKDVTDFDFIISRLTGTTIDEVIKLRGLQRAFLLRSRVTDEERVIYVAQGSQSQPGVNQGLFIVTGDFRKNRPNHEGPFATLDEAEPDAFEVFVQLRGTVLTLLFKAYVQQPDGSYVFEGSLQDSAPDNIVSDHAAPGAGDRRINGWMSCARCHVSLHQQKGMFISLVSDLGDALRRKQTNFTVAGADLDPGRLQRLTGSILTRWEKLLMRANDDQNDSANLLAGSLPPEGLTAVQYHIGNLVNMYNGYVHEGVDATRALRHAGIRVDEEDAPAVMRLLYPQVPGQVRYVDMLAGGREITSGAFRAVAVDLLVQSAEYRNGLILRAKEGD